MKLHLGPDLALPTEAATQTFLVVGKRGSGKSTTCVRLAEQLIKAHVPIVAVDPVDRWWALKAARDGKGPGLSVYVFGGEHADLPLEAGAGEIIADTIIEHRLSAVLSVKHLSGRERGRLTLLSGYRWSGGFRNALSALRTAGLLDGDNGGVMRLTAAGQTAAPDEPLPTGRALHDYWLTHPSFGKCEREVLRVLLDVYPRGLNSESLCEKSGYEWSGGFRNALSNLRTAGVLTGRNTGDMRASEELF